MDSPNVSRPRDVLFPSGALHGDCLRVDVLDRDCTAVRGQYPNPNISGEEIYLLMPMLSSELSTTGSHACLHTRSALQRSYHINIVVIPAAITSAMASSP